MSLYDDLLLQEAQLDDEHNDLVQTLAIPSIIDQHGMHPSTVSILKNTGLLNSVSADAIAVESFRNQNDYDQIGVETLTQAVSDKAAVWAAKILDKLKDAPDIMQKLLAPLMDKLKDVADELNEKLKDKTFGIKQDIKAHPYRTATVVLASLTSLMAVLAMCGSGMPGGNASRKVFIAFFSKIAAATNRIPWPFGKINATVNARGTMVIDKILVPKPTLTDATKAGWTKSTVKYMCDKSVDGSISLGGMITSLGKLFAKITFKGIPAAYNWGNKFRRSAPAVVHAATRSEALGHVTFVGLSIAFYTMVMKAFFMICKLIYNVGGNILLFFKGMLALFM